MLMVYLNAYGLPNVLESQLYNWNMMGTSWGYLGKTKVYNYQMVKERWEEAEKRRRSSNSATATGFTFNLSGCTFFLNIML